MGMTVKEVRATFKNALTQGWITANIKYMPKVQSLMGKKAVRTATMAFAAAPMLCQPAFATTAQLADNITQATDQIYQFIRGLVTGIGIVALAACGIVLLLGLGGQRAAENAKAWIVRIVIGMMLVYMAQPLIGWVAGIAGNNAGGTGGLVE